MRKMKPFKKYAEGGDTGVREGRNVNISDETRQRALDRMEARRVMESMKSDAPETAPKPRAKPAAKPMAKPTAKVTDTGDESARMARRAPAPAPRPAVAERSDTPDASMQGARDKSVPRVFTDEERAERAKQPTKRSFMSELKAESPKLLAGIAGVGAATGIREILKRAAAKRGADNIMAAASKRAAGVRADKKAESASERTARVYQKRHSAPKREAPRDLDEERMSGEGGGFKKGGSVRGCGIARKGLTKGKMR